jgi:hypothetical protein
MQKKERKIRRRKNAINREKYNCNKTEKGAF